MIRKAELKKQILELQESVLDLRQRLHEQAYYHYVSPNPYISPFFYGGSSPTSSITYRDAIDAICDHLGVKFDTILATPHKIVVKPKSEVKE